MPDAMPLMLATLTLPPLCAAFDAAFSMIAAIMMIFLSFTPYAAMPRFF